MTKQQREIARNLRKHVESIEPIKARGTLQEYFTVYSDRKRGDGDYSKAHETTLYKKFGFEYCVLVEVLAGVR